MCAVDRESFMLVSQKHEIMLVIVQALLTHTSGITIVLLMRHSL